MLPGDGRVVSNVIVQALGCDPFPLYGGGSQTRKKICFVNDLVEGLIRFMNGAHTVAFNISNPAEFTIKQLAELVRERINPQLDLWINPCPGHPLQRQPVNDLARADLGWEPTVPLEQVLELTIAYFRQSLNIRK